MEALIGFLIAWPIIGICLSAGFLLGFTLSLLSGDDLGRKDALTLLRWMGTAMLWPLLLPGLLVYGGYRLFRLIRTGK
jgi:hypothetical protein